MTFVSVVAAALGDSPSPNVAPTVSVGSATQAVNAPATVTLTSTATDADGDTLDPTEAGWLQISGPTTLSPDPPTDSRTWSNIVFDTAGTYVLRAYQVDPRGAIGTANKTITVTAAGGPGNQAEERLGLFARTGYGGDGAGPRPTVTKTAAGAVTFVQSYWEPDGLRAYAVRELISSADRAAWRSNVTGYLPTYKTLCQAPRSTIMLYAVPMFTGDEAGSTVENMRQAYEDGTNGAYIGDPNTTGYWTLLRNTMVTHRYGIDFPVWIDPFSEYDLGDPNNFPNVAGQPGRLNWGRMRDGVECARAFYEYLSATCPLVEFMSCRISAGGTAKYMNASNAVETFGGQFPSGLNMSAALLFEVNRASSPVGDWFTALNQNCYMNSESAALTKFADTQAAVAQYGIATGFEEVGVASQTVTTDNLAMRQFLERQRALCNSLPASGAGSLKTHIYFEGLDPSCLYSHYPLALADFKTKWHA